MHSSGWVPALELRDVVLLDAEQREALRLPRVVAALSPRSLLALELRFEQLLIDGAELEVRRDAQRPHLRRRPRLRRQRRGGDDGAAADWFFEQREFVIRGGTLRWIDEQRGAPPLALTDVELVVRNGLRRHDAAPRRHAARRTGASASRCSGRFTQPLLGRARRLAALERHASTPTCRAPTCASCAATSTLPFELSEGDGALRAWVDVDDGQPRGATRRPRAARGRAAPRRATSSRSRFEQVEGRLDARSATTTASTIAVRAASAS